MLDAGHSVLKKCDLPSGEIVAWREAMKKSDRVGFICEGQLQALQDRFKK